MAHIHTHIQGASGNIPSHFTGADQGFPCRGFVLYKGVCLNREVDLLTHYSAKIRKKMILHNKQNNILIFNFL